jgi:gliding motility-associated-like protein
MKYYFTLLCMLLSAGLYAQSFTFAELKGSPLNTSGWNLAGSAAIGDTPGDANNDPDELILTPPVNFVSGAAFYSQPFNASVCQRWTVEFDYRIWDGSAADGIAFCYLADPPSGFVAGGGIGIPALPRGLMIVLDTYNNADCGGFVNPELQIRYSDGTRNYEECPIPPQPTAGPVAQLRSATYNRMRITYTDGTISVFINNMLILNGFYRIDFPGYFGFTASTGGSTDRHSVRDVEIRTDPLIQNRADAGPDVNICNGGTATLGAPSSGGNYRYTWQPATGLSNPNVPNPTVTLENNSDQSRQFRYFLTKDTIGASGLCPTTDEVIVTVSGRLVSLPNPSPIICSGAGFKVNVSAQAGISYQWTPVTGIANPTLADPFIVPPLNTSTSPVVREYVLSARNSLGCVSTDTLRINVLPAPVNTPWQTLRVCSGDALTLGSPAQPGVSYNWQPGGSTTATLLVVPQNNTSQDSIRQRYIRAASIGGCTSFDTTDLIIYRAVSANAGPDREVCSNVAVVLGTPAQPGLSYRWSPSVHLSDAQQAQPVFRLSNTGSTPLVSSYILEVRNAGGCLRTDTVRISVLPGNLPEGRRNRIQLCSGEEALLGTPSVAGFTYQWSPLDNLSGDQSAQVLFKAPASITADSVVFRYFRQISNAACQSTDTIEVSVFRRPVANPSVLIPACSGQPVSLGAPAELSFSYEWQPASHLNDSRIAQPRFVLENTGNTAIERTYFRIARSTAGCTSTDTIRVSVAPALGRLGATANLRICAGNSLVLGSAAQEGYSYRWSPATGLSNAQSANPTFTATQAGIFQYVLTSSFGSCSASDTFGIEVKPLLPTPLIVGSVAVCPNASGIRYEVQNLPQGSALRWQVSGGSIRQGQGTPVVLIDWHGPNSIASISVQSDSSVACSPVGQLAVNIGVQLKPQRPQSMATPDTLCLSEASSIIYETPAIAGSIFNWGISANGRILSGQGSNRIQVSWTAAGTGRLWINEQVNTSSNTCFGTSDTLYVLIKPLPTADSLEGPALLCTSSEALYSLRGGQASSVYEWTIEGGTLLSHSGSTVRVQWGAPGQAWIQVRETGANGCAGNLVRLPVQIAPKPQPRILRSDSLICRIADLERLYCYSVEAQTGSSLNWIISGGNIVSQDERQICVRWQEGSPPQLAVQETSAVGCTGEVLPFRLLEDRTFLQIHAASVDPTDDTRVIVRFSVRGSVLPRNLVMERSTDGGLQWGFAGELRSSDSLFIDNGQPTNSLAIQYRFRDVSVLGCPPAISMPHSLMLLSGNNTGQNEVDIAWSAYQGWPQGVARYEIWRALDGSTSFSLYESGSDISLRGINAKDGFRQCFRIRAVEASGTNHSWSNTWCVDFDHPISIPNVVTPNGDGRNDVWVINNLELYTEHNLQIFNRYGKQIFSSGAYRSTWPDTQTGPGTYYYSLQVIRPAIGAQPARTEFFKGWVQILKE